MKARRVTTAGPRRPSTRSDGSRPAYLRMPERRPYRMCFVCKNYLAACRHSEEAA